MRAPISDVLIVGGGFAGPAAAAALSAAGAEVAVLEALAGSGPGFRGELLHPPGVRTLDEIGLGAAIASSSGVEVHGFAAFDGLDRGAVHLRYPMTSPRGFGFDHAALVRHLREELACRPGVRILTRARVEQLIYERGRAIGVRCSGGLEHRASLLVAADGRHSKLRKLLGIPTDATLLSQMVVVGLEGDLLPSPNLGHVFAGAPGPAIAYPYGVGKVRVCVDVPLGIAGGRRGIATYVREHYARVLPEPLRGALIAALGRAEFSGCANHAIYTATCVAPGVALVGDAGGCSHPLTATGMTSALRDVSTLAACLSGGTVEDALEEYRRRRYRFVRAREVFAHALYDVFRGASPGALTLRGGMFRYWRADERARRASMQILSGEDSRVTSFLAEYVRVLGDSGRLAWGGQARDGEGLRQLGRMLVASAEGVRPFLRVARASRRFHVTNARERARSLRAAVWSRIPSRGR